MHRGLSNENHAITGHELRCDTSLHSRADIDFCLQSLLRDRIVLVGGWFSFIHTCFAGGGGAMRPTVHPSATSRSCRTAIFSLAALALPSCQAVSESLIVLGSGTASIIASIIA